MLNYSTLKGNTTQSLSMSHENYRRDEDKAWRERVEERLAALTSGETVQDDRLDELEKELTETERRIEGDSGTDGFVQRLKLVEHNINKLLTILTPDSIGNPGLIQKVETLWRKKAESIAIAERRWGFWGIVVVAIIGSITSIVTNFDKIEGFISNKSVESRSTKKSSKVTKPKKKIAVDPPAESTATTN